MKRISYQIISFLILLTICMLPHLSNAQCPVPTLPGKLNFKPEWAEPKLQLQWAPNNPLRFITYQVELSVIHGIPPYVWSVAERGFVLAPNLAKDPTGSIYTLTAHSSTSGVATITVSDNSTSPPVSGIIRIPTWVVIGHYHVSLGVSEAWGEWNNLQEQGFSFGDADCLSDGVVTGDKYRVREDLGNETNMNGVCSYETRYGQEVYPGVFDICACEWAQAFNYYLRERTVWEWK